MPFGHRDSCCDAEEPLPGALDGSDVLYLWNSCLISGCLVSNAWLLINCRGETEEVLFRYSFRMHVRLCIRSQHSSIELRLHDKTGYTTGFIVYKQLDACCACPVLCTASELYCLQVLCVADFSDPVYTIQPVVKPVELPVEQPAASCKQTSNGLSNRLINRLGNRLYRVNGVSHTSMHFVQSTKV